MDIYLIRHGERQEDGALDTMQQPLTEQGIRQAILTGERLAGMQIDQMYASSMRRAIQTAEAINRFLHLPVIVRPELREIEMGDFRLGWESLRKNHPAFAAAFPRHETDLPYPGG